MTLKRFRRNKFSKKQIMAVVLFLLIGTLLIKSSFAVYQQEAEVQFINARIRWPKANEVTYTNENNSEITNIEEALNDLYGKLGS